MPETLEEALGLLEAHGREGARVLAGGTDLLVNMNSGAYRPKMVIALDRIAGMDGIEMSDGKIRVGGRTTFNAILRSDEIRVCAPVLHSAVRNIGSPQIRSRATIGGNISNASPCADSLPALCVLGATVTLTCCHGTRVLPIEDCFRGPKETVFHANEILTGLEFPIPGQPECGFYLAMGQRNAVAITKLSVAGQFEIGEDGTVQDAKIAFGAVAPTVVRGLAVEEYLKGRRITPEVLEECAALAIEATKPITDIRSTEEYRHTVTALLLNRGLESLVKCP